jgi:arylsulfatase A-like enzyme
MKKRKKIILWASVVAFAALLTWLLWPLASRRWNITRNAPAIAYKKEFLQQPAQADTGKRRPNIIIILADDLSKYDVSLYGGKNVSTPNIDRIGAEGVYFTDGYVTAPICAPSRAAMLTGRYNQRFGFEIQPQKRYPKNRLEYLAFRYFIDTDNWQVANGLSYPYKESIRDQGLPPSEITLAELLKKQNYATGITGKWHLGHTDGHLPNQLGFDYQYGFYEAFTWYVADTADPEIEYAVADEFTDHHIWKQGRKNTCAIRRNDTIIEEKEYLTFAIAREAIRFIRGHKDGPFFLYIPFNAPHTPFQVPRSYYDQFPEVKAHDKRVYYAMIKALDDAVGLVMKELETQGLDENTLVWFASDNGGATYTGTADNSPLKGGKLSNFEGGINVPYMVRWKGMITAGQQYAHPVSLMDIFSTSAVVAGALLPSDREYDGVDLLPFIADTTHESVPHPTLYWRADYNKAIRKGNWKLIVDHEHKVIRLYDLASDRFEKSDRHTDFPELIRELEGELETWEKEMMQPLWPRIMDYKMVIGDEVYYFAV